MFNVLFGCLFGWIFQLLLGLLWLVLGLVCLSTILLTLNAQNWPVDLLSHFRPHYTVILAIGLPLHLFLSRNPLFKWTGLVLAAVCFLLNLSAVWPYFLPHQQTLLPESPRQDLSILHLNALYLNHNQEAVRNLIIKANADVVSLAEYSQWWEEHLPDPVLRKRYPHQITAPFPGQLSLWSKYPFRKFVIDPVGHETSLETIRERRLSQKEFTLVGLIDTGKAQVTVLASHPAIPLRYEWWVHQQEMHMKWNTLLQKFPKTTRVLVGDFNSTPFSVWFQPMLDNLNVLDSMTLSGWQPTWPASIPILNMPLPLWPGIAIDQILLSPDILLLERYTGSWVGSDHLPVFAKIAIPRQVTSLNATKNKLF
jgi:endonuclease/exonuclease/phosphatase (EEP) superfamily protein YafD